MKNINEQVLDTVMKRGVLMTYHIRYWRAHKKLNPEDIGIAKESVNEKLVSLGHKKLVSSDVLETFALLESRAGTLINRHSFDFMHGVGRYVPNTALQTVMTEWGKLREEFWAKVTEFKANYTDIRRKAKVEWYEAAVKLVPDPQRLVDAIEKSYPSDAELDNYFAFDQHVFQIALPEETSVSDWIQESEEVLQARTEAAQHARSTILAGVNGFVDGCVTQMRQDLAGLVTDMQEAVAHGKIGVHQRTLNRLGTFIEQYKMLNFAEDSQLEKELEDFQAKFLNTSAEDYRADQIAQRSLLVGLSNLRQTAQQMIAEGSSSVVAGFGKAGARKLDLGAAPGSIS